jgi:hypothetical protein
MQSWTDFLIGLNILSRNTTYKVSLKLSSFMFIQVLTYFFRLGDFLGVLYKIQEYRPLVLCFFKYYL